MNTVQLNCFLAVANSLSFARAAEQLGLTQPAVTHQIKNLETELNVQLFHRSTHMVELTPEGLTFLADARNIMAISEQAKARFNAHSETPIERLTIGCSGYYQLCLLSDSLRELRASCPNLHPNFYVVPRPQLFRLLERETLDIAFDMLECGESGEKLTFQAIRQSPISCVCGRDHPLAGRACVDRAGLLGERLIFCDPINLTPEIANLQWRLAQRRAPADMLFCGTIEAAITLAETGFGVAFLPEVLVPRQSGTVTVELEGAPQLTFGMFYKPYPGDSILKQFIKIAQRQFSKKGTCPG